MPLVLTNTLTRQKDVFVPADPARVTMYVCGPTVYNFAHIGNARPAVVFDVLYRLLKRRFGRVVYARNFTDVDDKINVAAKEAGLPISTVTERYIEAYHADMAALGVLTPDLEPRVTEHVPEITGMVGRLIARGHAYAAEGHVLFHVPSFSAYGALSGRNRDEMIAQGTCAHDGELYCRYWVHNGFVTVEGRKMSKSLGNVLLVRDLLGEAPGEARS